MHLRAARCLSRCLIAATLLAAGCAQIPRVDDPERHKIDTVVIERQVSKPEQIWYLGPGAGPLFLFGAVGVVVAKATGALDEVTTTPGEQLLAHARKNGIEMDKIVYQEADAAVRQWGKLTVLDAAADPPAAPNVGTLKMSVLRYGFSIPTGFSSRLVPIVIIKCDLFNSSGKLVWSGYDRTQPLGNPVDSLSLEEMRDKPETIEAAWRGASRYIIKRVLDKYAGEG